MCRTTLLCATALFMQTLGGCGSSFTSGGYSGGPERASDPTSATPGSTPTRPTPQPGSGILSAGDWDDNLNFNLFQKYVAHPPKGAPDYQVADRVLITVRDAAGAPVGNARVSLSSGQHVVVSVPTGSDGRAALFPGHDGATPETALTVQVTPPVEQPAVAAVSQPLAAGQTDLVVTLAGAQSRTPESLDLAFVVDATGSMGDEIRYLQAELADIAAGVRAEYPAVNQRYALIVYRDRSDQYVTRSFDFTTNLTSFQTDLDAQRADGGGDLPEAMDAAAVAMNQLSWRSGNVARLAFLVADAPPHSHGTGHLLEQLQQARLTGIRMYPVAASGVDASAEYVMRIAAQLTLGRYIFLTDDSGVGGSHMEPHIPCYQVLTLNKVILRSIRSELAGARQPVDPTTVIRSVGSPMMGTCTLQDGTKAYL